MPCETASHRHLAQAASARRPGSDDRVRARTSPKAASSVLDQVGRVALQIDAKDPFFWPEFA